MNPRLLGIVFDRPTVVAEAVAETKRAGLEDRTGVVAGDFFESVPAGADLYLLKRILHDWDDASCVTILRRCCEAMAPRGRIAVIEALVGELEDPGRGALTDMTMLALVPGQERSVAEYAALFEAAGLRRTAVRRTDAPHSVIEAVAAPGRTDG